LNPSAKGVSAAVYGTLRWEELKELVLDVEVALNNRPLTYLDEDIQLSVSTPNAMLHIDSNHLPEQPHHLKGFKEKSQFYTKVQGSHEETMDSRIRPKSSGKSPSGGGKPDVPPTSWRRRHNLRQQEEPKLVEACRC